MPSKFLERNHKIPPSLPLLKGGFPLIKGGMEGVVIPLFGKEG